MASTNGVIFPESMADFLADPVDICFGSMPTTSTTPVVCLVIEGNAVTTNQQIEIDLYNYVTIMMATLGKPPSMLATSSLDASRRPTACTSSLPLGRDPSSSRK
jgi:hypothetical protein